MEYISGKLQTRFLQAVYITVTSSLKQRLIQQKIRFYKTNKDK